MKTHVLFPQALSEARDAINKLFSRIKDIKDKAETSEKMVSFKLIYSLPDILSIWLHRSLQIYTIGFTTLLHAFND